MKRPALGVLACVAASTLPEVARACAVCFSATDESEGAYRFTTLLLSAVPLLALGGFFGWVRWRIRTRERALGALAASAAAPAPLRGSTKSSG